MNLPLIILTTSLIFMLGFAVLIFLFIVIRRIVIQKNDARRKKIKNAVEGDVLEYLTSGTEQSAEGIASRYSRYPHILTSVLVDFIESIKGEKRDQLKILFDHALREKTLNAIDSCWLRRRLRATRVFIMFSSSYDSNRIIRLLRDKAPVKLAALDSLSRVPNEEAFSQIFKTFEKDPDPNLQEYKNIMYSLGQNAESLVKKYLKRPLSAEKLCLLIEITGAVPIPSLHPELLRFEDNPELEIRISLARALGNLITPLPEVIQALMKLSRDEAWEVRAQALKSLGNLQSQSALDIMTESLFSPHWYCRLNAGHALTKLGQKGMERLNQVSIQEEDSYAADMARMVLEESIIS